MPTYPATRRFFRDDECRNDNAAISGLVRELALWENYTYARDLKVTPSDAKIFAGDIWPWSADPFAWSPIHLFPSGAVTAAHLAEFIAPDPRGPYTRIKVFVNLDPGVGTLDGAVTVTNATTGEASTITLSGTSFGINEWRDTTISASPGDAIRVSAQWNSGAAFEVSGLSAIWDPASLSLAGATFSAGWAALSQAFHATNGPLSTYAMRWLGRTANAMLYERPLQVAASYFGKPAAGVGAGYSTLNPVGRYMIHVGGRCARLDVRVGYRASGACTVNLTLSGGATGSITIPGAGSGIATGAITFSPAAGAAQELLLTVAGSPTYCDIEHVAVRESSLSATDLALPGGQTVPASFDPNLDERLGSGRAIRADDIARLVANMTWLWAFRRDRVLVNDCRFVYDEYDNFSFTGAGGLTDRAARHELYTSKWNAGDAFGEVEVRAGWSASATGGTSASRFQVGRADAGDYLGSPAKSGTRSTFLRSDWTALSSSRWQHAHGASPATTTNYVYETVLLVSAGSKGTRPTWLVLEELPMDTPALTYP